MPANHTASQNSSAPAFSSRWQFLSLLAIGLNLGIFVLVFGIPIGWNDLEILCHRFFWNANGIGDLHLHSGLWLSDWIKPFDATLTDGEFRVRHVSYFFEMLGYKFWQALGALNFQDYSLFCFHLLNTFLLGRLVSKMTQSPRAGLTAALLFLNSGIAVATLLYPFRNAKLLVMTFILLAWLIAAGTRPLAQASPARLFGFFFFIALAAFTDEIVVFFVPLILIYLWIRDGSDGFLHPRLIRGATLTVLLGGLFLLIAFKIFFVLHPWFPWGVLTESHRIYLDKVFLTELRSGALPDVLRSIGGYFLRRNFGYWDATAAGLLAAAAFLILMGKILIKKEASSLEKRLTLVIVAVIFLKAFLLPHYNGIHKDIMPQDAVFASLHFFSYYYTYGESLLLALVAGIWLKPALRSPPGFVSVLLCLAVMAFSNVQHLQQGPADILAFQDFKSPAKQKMFEDILLTRQFLSTHPSETVYLAFPGQDRPLFHGTLPLPPSAPAEWYGRLIFDYFLESMEKGRVRVSYENVRKPAREGEELTSAGIFYDLAQRKAVDLSQKLPMLPFAPGTRSVAQCTPILADGHPTVAFFLKGRSRFLLEWGQEKFDGQQTYGNSFQMFEFSSPTGVTGPARVTVQPDTSDRSVTIAGNCSPIPNP